MGVAVLVMVAQLTAARPRECARAGLAASAVGNEGTNVWERAKEPRLRRYCDLLASGAAKVVTNPAAAPEVAALADEAEALRPGHGAPLVLKARAFAQAGRVNEARHLFVEARKRDPFALDEPASLLAWARVQARVGDVKEALATYRVVLPQASALPAADRGAAALEAGILAMTEGPAGLDGVLVFLRQARQETFDAAQGVACLALALALHRGGARDEARAVLADQVRGDPRPLLEVALRRGWLLGPAAKEARAMTALALESRDAAASQEAWRDYVDAVAPDGPWAAHGKAQLKRSAKEGGGRP